MAQVIRLEYTVQSSGTVKTGGCPGGGGAKRPKNRRLTVEQVPYIHVDPISPFWSEIDAIVNPKLELVWNGKSNEVCNIVLPFQVIEQVDEPDRLYGFPRNRMGDENMAYAFYDQPELMRAMVNDLGERLRRQRTEPV